MTCILFRYLVNPYEMGMPKRIQYCLRYGDTWGQWIDLEEQK